LEQAVERWSRLEEQLPLLFPFQDAGHRKIESPLKHIPTILDDFGDGLQQVLVKCDHALPITGCVKARGAFYELFSLAENIALDAGLTDESRRFNLASCRDLFSRTTVVTGSTGNLGFSVGIIAKALGFKAVIHMSSDAKGWKKARLREMDVHVVEHDADYSAAVAAARISAIGNDNCYFVDDEDSLPLFLGYALSAFELRDQLSALGINPTAERPLYVYLPCGVGGAPAGITFGVKLLFGDAVKCVFIEPVQSPSMLLQLLVGPGEPISVYDIGLSNKTAADGLAVGAASIFAATQCQHLVDYCITIRDLELYTWVKNLWTCERVRLEPSAAAGFAGAARLFELLLDEQPERLSYSDHVIWTTGGSHLPVSEHEQIIETAIRDSQTR
jgi:D-serine dehydratase